MNADDWIDKLGLQPHPEGGYFREVWRSGLQLELDGYQGPRSAGTSIYFMLKSGEASAWHRVASDELWFWNAGDPLALRVASQRDGDAETFELGREQFQALVPGGKWQAAEPLDGNAGYALVSCVVVPGFDFADFEM